jgi:hypothetical protein
LPRRRVGGDHADHFFTPSGDDNQDAALVGGANLHNAFFPVIHLQGEIDGVVQYNLLPFRRGDPVLDDMFAVLLVPIKSWGIYVSPPVNE